MKPRILLPLLLTVALSGCGTYYTSSTQAAKDAPDAKALAPHHASDVTLTEEDITNRPYTSLGDITVTVRKVSIFDKDPTREKVNDALKDRAAEMGGDAVVLAHYGTVGMGAWSWGQMEGSGRVVVFK